MGLSGFRIFPFVSFSHGIFSHLSLRNHNNWYLGDTRGVSMGRVQLSTLNWGVTFGGAETSWGVSLGGAETTRTGLGEKGWHSSWLSCSPHLRGGRVKLLLGEGIHCCHQSPALPCFLLSWLSVCSCEQPLNRDLIGTLPHWKGPLPSVWVPQGKRLGP